METSLIQSKSQVTDKEFVRKNVGNTKTVEGGANSQSDE